jgi:hypothetical protein
LIFQTFLNMIKNKELLKDLLLNTLKSEHGVNIKENKEFLGFTNKFENILISLFSEICSTKFFSSTSTNAASFLPHLMLKSELQLSGITPTNVFENFFIKKSIKFLHKVLVKSSKLFSGLPFIVSKLYLQKIYYYSRRLNQLLKIVKTISIVKRKMWLLSQYKTFLAKNLKNSVYTAHLSVRYACNNIFCTFKNLKSNKILYATSTGKEKLKASKKTLRFISKVLLTKFFEKVKLAVVEIERFDSFPRVLVTLNVPKKSRKFLLLVLQSFFKRQKIAITLHFKENKCFNGCRPKKQQRKKRKGFKHLK